MIDSTQFNLIAQSMNILPSIEYILADHLGSSSITTNADGDKTSEVHYTPWGEVLDSWSASASLPMKYTFTGQMSYMDDPITSGTTEGFGLMFFNARWLDPAIGRFAQADSIVPPGVQGLDRYAYVNNNPMRYTDPTGHMCSDPEYPTPSCDGSSGGGSSGGSGNGGGGGGNGGGAGSGKGKGKNSPDLCKVYGECDSSSTISQQKYTPPCISGGDNNFGYCISGNLETIWTNGNVTTFDLTITGTTVGNPTQAQLDEFEKQVALYEAAKNGIEKDFREAALALLGLGGSALFELWPATVVSGGFFVDALYNWNQDINDRSSSFNNGVKIQWLIARNDTPGIVLSPIASP